MKFFFTICILVFGVEGATSRTYLSKSNIEIRCQEIEKVIRAVKNVSKEVGPNIESAYFTCVFSNKSGMPLLVIYYSGTKPYLLHDWESNKMFFLGYKPVQGDTILFYSDIFDFYPNGIAEDYLKGMDVRRDSIFDKYYYPNHWYNSGFDELRSFTYKVNRNGTLRKKNNKYQYRLSKWYKKTYYRSDFIPPSPPSH